MNEKAMDCMKTVKEKFGKIALQSLQENSTSCCGATISFFDVDDSIFNDTCDGVDGHLPEADLGPACGIPAGFAQMKQSI